MKIGEALYNYLQPPNPLTAIYPGPHRRKEGTYEEDFESILKQMQKRDPCLKLNKVAITLDWIYKDPSYEGYRGKDFDRIIMQDLEQTETDGLLFLPQFETWSKRTNLLQKVTSLLPKYEGAMSLFYQVNEKYVTPILKLIEEKNYKPIHLYSHTYGHSIAVKYPNHDTSGSCNRP